MPRANKKPHRLSDAEVTEILELKESGRSNMAIARKFGITNGTVLYHATLAGLGKHIAYRPRASMRNGYPVVPFSAAEDARMQELRTAGMTVTEIGRAMSRSPNSLRHRLARLALEAELVLAA